MTAAEQTKALIQIMRKVLEHLKSLPVDEAKEHGLRNLQVIGILDKDGNVTEGYKGLL
jgi:hypothetical protein